MSDRDVEPRILHAAVDYWRQVDPDLGTRVAQGVGLREAIRTGG
jgi:hypothetical protein